MAKHYSSRYVWKQPPLLNKVGWIKHIFNIQTEYLQLVIHYWQLLVLRWPKLFTNCRVPEMKYPNWYMLYPKTAMNSSLPYCYGNCWSQKWCAYDSGSHPPSRKNSQSSTMLLGRVLNMNAIITSHNCITLAVSYWKRYELPIFSDITGFV